MKKNMGEFNEAYKKMFNSFKKRFHFEAGESLEILDKVFEDHEYKQYPVVFISHYDTGCSEFIKNINDRGEAQAYGYYKDGEFAYSNFNELKENILKVIYENDMDKFLFISVGYKSTLLLDIPGAICIKMGITNGELILTINKTRRIIPNEVIRDIAEDDINYFYKLFSKYNDSRVNIRPDIFSINYKKFENELYEAVKRINGKNVVVCFKDGALVGFLIYYTKDEGDGIRIRKRYIFTIKEIFVAEEYRRSGIATRMYEEVLKRAERARADKINFMVWAEDQTTNKFITSLQPKPVHTLYELDVE